MTDRPALRNSDVYPTVHDYRQQYLEPLLGSLVPGWRPGPSLTTVLAERTWHNPCLAAAGLPAGDRTAAEQHLVQQFRRALAEGHR